MRSATALCAVFLCLSPAARADAPLGLDYTLTDCAELPDEPALEDGALTSCFAPPSGLAPNSGELTLYRDPVRDAYLAMILDRIPGHYQHRLRFFRFPTTMVGCAEITLLGEGRYIDLFPGTPDETNQDADAMSFPDLVPLDDGRVLVIRQDGTLHSLSFNGGAIAANRVTTPSALSALLRPEGFAASIAPLRHADALMAATLTPRSVTALAGGGFAALVVTDVGRDAFTDVNLAWVVRVNASGNLSRLAGPWPDTMGPRVFLDRETDLLITFPMAGERLVTTVSDGQISTEIPSGVGIGVIPASGPPIARPGYVELSWCIGAAIAAIGAADANTWALDGLSLETRNDGSVAMDLRLTAVSSHAGRRAYVSIPAALDAMDLDGDGLTPAAEAALGTSNLARDSDGDGAPDGIEALYGTNPAAGDDARVVTDRRLDPFIDYVPSILVREIPGISELGRVHALLRWTWPSRWVCDGTATCIDRTGARRNFPATNSAVVLEDGEQVVDFDGADIVATHIETGARRIVAPGIADLASAGLVAGRGDMVYVYWVNAGLRIMEFNTKTGAARVIWSPERFGTCAGCPLGFAPDYVEYLGWDPVTARHLVHVRGLGPHLWAIGPEPTDEPVLIAHLADFDRTQWSPATGGFGGFYRPVHFLPIPSATATPGLWVTYADIGATLSGYVDGAFQFYDGPRALAVSGYHGRGWDASLFVQSLDGAGAFAPGIVEVHPVDNRIAPGDVLVIGGPYRTGEVGQPPTGAFLWRVAPRGGATPLYGERPNYPGEMLGGLSEPAHQPTGMGISADGRICVTTQSETFLLDSVDADRRLPTRRVAFDVTNAADCAFRGDTLEILRFSPPSIVSLDGGNGSQEATVATLELPGTPTRFERVGRWLIVADAFGAAVCVAPDGTETRTSVAIAGLATRSTPNTLWVMRRPDGQLGHIDVDALCGGTAEPTWLGLGWVEIAATAGFARHQTYETEAADLAERPDGRIAVVQTVRPDALGHDQSAGIVYSDYPYLVDPRDNSVVPASAHELGAGEHVTLAVVPGGTWTDPWDRALVPPLGDGDAEPGPDMGAETIADAAPRGDDGCRGASTLAAHLTWVWLLVILMDRRRRHGLDGL